VRRNTLVNGQTERLRFLNALFWEFIQNLPIVAGFVTALASWQQERRWIGIACVVSGCVSGALVIRFTEAKIVKERQEAWRVTIMNIVVMSTLALILVIYLWADWSSWKTDLPLGMLAGIGVAMAQDLAAGDRIGVRHCIALGVAVPIALAGTRTLIAALPTLPGILAITVLGTLVIGSIDYGPTLNRKE
jgi:hypothetical protein